MINSMKNKTTHTINDIIQDISSITYESTESLEQLSSISKSILKVLIGKSHEYTFEESLLFIKEKQIVGPEVLEKLKFYLLKLNYLKYAHGSDYTKDNFEELQRDLVTIAPYLCKENVEQFVMQYFKEKSKTTEDYKEDNSIELLHKHKQEILDAEFLVEDYFKNKANPHGNTINNSILPKEKKDEITNKNGAFNDTNKLPPILPQNNASSKIMQDVLETDTTPKDIKPTSQPQSNQQIGTNHETHVFSSDQELDTYLHKLQEELSTLQKADSKIEHKSSTQITTSQKFDRIHAPNIIRHFKQKYVDEICFMEDTVKDLESYDHLIHKRILDYEGNFKQDVTFKAFFSVLFHNNQSKQNTKTELYAKLYLLMGKSDAEIMSILAQTIGLEKISSKEIEMLKKEFLDLVPKEYVVFCMITIYCYLHKITGETKSIIYQDAIRKGYDKRLVVTLCNYIYLYF